MPFYLRWSGLLRTPVIPHSVHQRIVPDLLQLLGVLHHGAALRPVCRQALHGILQVFHPFPQPVPDLPGKAAVFLYQLLRRRAVLQHHLAGVGHHLVHGLVVVKPRLPPLLVRHEVFKAHALFVYQPLHDELLQLLVLSAVLLDEVGQLVGGGFQHGRFRHAHGVPSGVDVQIEGAVLIEAVGALVLALLVGLALVEHHVDARHLGKGSHGLHGSPLACVHGLPVHWGIGRSAHGSPSQAHRGLFYRGGTRSPAGTSNVLIGMLRRLLPLLVGHSPLHIAEVTHALRLFNIVHGHASLAVFVGQLEGSGVQLHILLFLPIGVYHQRPRLLELQAVRPVKKLLLQGGRLRLLQRLGFHLSLGVRHNGVQLAGLGVILGSGDTEAPVVCDWIDQPRPKSTRPFIGRDAVRHLSALLVISPRHVRVQLTHQAAAVFALAVEQLVFRFGNVLAGHALCDDLCQLLHVCGFAHGLEPVLRGGLDLFLVLLHNAVFILLHNAHELKTGELPTFIQLLLVLLGQLIVRSQLLGFIHNVLRLVAVHLFGFPRLRVVVIQVYAALHSAAGRAGDSPYGKVIQGIGERFGKGVRVATVDAGHLPLEEIAHEFLKTFRCGGCAELQHPLKRRAANIALAQLFGCLADAVFHYAVKPALAVGLGEREGDVEHLLREHFLGRLRPAVQHLPFQVCSVLTGIHCAAAKGSCGKGDHSAWRHDLLPDAKRLLEDLIPAVPLCGSESHKSGHRAVNAHLRHGCAGVHQHLPELRRALLGLLKILGGGFLHAIGKISGGGGCLLLYPCPLLRVNNAKPVIQCFQILCFKLRCRVVCRRQCLLIGSLAQRVGKAFHFGECRIQRILGLPVVRVCVVVVLCSSYRPLCLPQLLRVALRAAALAKFIGNAHSIHVSGEASLCPAGNRKPRPLKKALFLRLCAAARDNILCALGLIKSNRLFQLVPSVSPGIPCGYFLSQSCTYIPGLVFFPVFSALRTHVRLLSRTVRTFSTFFPAPCTGPRLPRPRSCPCSLLPP